MVAFSIKPLIGPFTIKEWERFLESSPPQDGVRLLLRKPKSAASGIAYPDALDVALCRKKISLSVTNHYPAYLRTIHCTVGRRILTNDRWVD